MKLPSIVKVSDYIAHYIKRYYYMYKPYLQPNYSSEFHNKIKQYILSSYLKDNNENTIQDSIYCLDLFGYGFLDFSKNDAFELSLLYEKKFDIEKNQCECVIALYDVAFFYSKEFTHDWIMCLMDAYHY